MLPEHPNSSASQVLSSSLYEIPITLRPFSVIETSFIVPSYPRSTHPIQGQESVSSLSALNPPDLPYHGIEKNFRPPTPDINHYPLRPDYQR